MNEEVCNRKKNFHNEYPYKDSRNIKTLGFTFVSEVLIFREATIEIGNIRGASVNYTNGEFYFKNFDRP